MPEGIKLHGSDSAWDVALNAIEHASDIDAATLLRHLAAPSAAGNIMRDTGAAWASVPASAYVPLPGAAVGDLLTWSAGAWTLLPDVAAGQPLLSGGVGVVPAYAGWTLTGSAGQTYDLAHGETAYGWGNHAGVYEPAGNLTTHANLTTTAHGGIVASTDARLTDARTPTDHGILSATHTVSGLTPGHFLKALTATTFGFAAHGLTANDIGAEPAGNLTTHANLTTAAHGGIVASNDARLTDARSPTAHAILGAAHTYTGGAALDVFGLSAANTLALLTPSANPGAASAILKTDASGYLRLVRLGLGVTPSYTLHTFDNTNADVCNQLQMSNTSTSGTKYAVRFIGGHTPAAASSTAIYAGYFQATVNTAAAAYTGTCAGVGFQSYTNAACANAIATLYGVTGTVEHYGPVALTTGYGGGFSVLARSGCGNITNASPLILGLYNQSASTISTGRLVEILSATNTGGGAITTLTGLYIGAQTVGGTNYSIYGNAGLYRFGDQLSIAGSADRSQLIVTGYATAQAVGTPIAQITRTDAASGIASMLGLTGLGSGAAADGISIDLKGKSSTTAAQWLGQISALWAVATHASAVSDLVLSAAYYNGLAIAPSEFLRGRGGANPAIGFLGVANPISRYSSTGDLRQCLIDFGLYTSGGATPLNLNGGALYAAAGTFSGDVKALGTGLNGLILYDTVLAAYYRITLTNGALVITAV